MSRPYKGLMENNMTNQTDSAILVFRWNADTPQVLRDLSDHGGDEDWVVVQRNVPPETKPEELGGIWDPDLPGTMLAGLLELRYGDDDPPKLIEWEGSLCAVWIFAH